MLWTPDDTFAVEEFENEADLEEAILIVKDALFGPSRIYLGAKKKIGAPGSVQTIPDGYLIDLSSRKKPVLYVVENELASHDPLKHVAVQILKFSLSYEESAPKVKAILKSLVVAQPDARKQCEEYAVNHGFENLDYLLEKMIFDGSFAALVVIDDLPDELEKVLASRFKFGVEVLTLQRFSNAQGHRIYQFSPFLEDVPGASTTEHGDSLVDPSEIDTIVVPARDEGFEETFIGENRWYKIRIHVSMIPKIRYIAAYRVAPTSAVTHVAPVSSVEPWPDSNKYVVNFSEPAHEIGPLKLVPDGKIRPLQNARYTSYQKLRAARSLDDAF